MWPCDEAAIGIPGARHKIPWNAKAIIGQGMCRLWDMVFNSSVQSACLWDVSPKRVPIDGDSQYELWASRMQKTYLGFSRIDLVVLIYQSVKFTYVSPDSDV